MEIRFRTKREAWEQGYQDGASVVQHDLNLIKQDAAKAAREQVLPVLEQCDMSLKRAIERSNELHKMACDLGATPQNQGQYIALLESTIRDIKSLRAQQQEQS
jgi:L-2-hydroxyglutarate oxidase LhgO